MKKLSIVAAVLLAFALWIVEVWTANASPAPLANAVILVIRHAEKPDDGPGLAPAGVARANAYVRYFEHFTLGGKPRVPDYLMASADSRNSERPRLTLTPLSSSLHLPLDVRFKDKDTDDAAQALLTTHTGKTILVCWHHEQIADLLSSLGANPNTLLPGGDWPDSVYNWVVVLHYDSRGALIPGKSHLIHEHLMPGDI